MIARRRVGIIVILVTLGCVMYPDRGHAWPERLGTSQENYARDLESQHFNTADRAGAKGAELAVHGLERALSTRAPKSVITEVRWLGSPATTDGPPRFMLVVRYEYATGLTWRTTIDLAENTDKRIAAFEATLRPTPLAPEELELAREIAGAERLEFVVEPRPNIRAQVQVEAFGSALYGHRLAVIARDESEPTVQVLVDLSTMKALNRDL